MKKYIIALLLLGSPLVSFAAFDTNLRFGDTGQHVSEAQEFLIGYGCLNAQATGNFYTLTLNAVKCFQERENISPVSGFWGPLTRAKAQSLIADDLSASTQAEVAETGSTVSSTEDMIALIKRIKDILDAQAQDQKELKEDIKEQKEIQKTTEEKIQKVVDNTKKEEVVGGVPDPVEEISYSIKNFSSNSNLNGKCFYTPETNPESKYYQIQGFPPMERIEVGLGSFDIYKIKDPLVAKEYIYNFSIEGNKKDGQLYGIGNGVILNEVGNTFTIKYKGGYESSLQLWNVKQENDFTLTLESASVDGVKVDGLPKTFNRVHLYPCNQ